MCTVCITTDHTLTWVYEVPILVVLPILWLVWLLMLNSLSTELVTILAALVGLRLTLEWLDAVLTLLKKLRCCEQICILLHDVILVDLDLSDLALLEDFHHLYRLLVRWLLRINILILAFVVDDHGLWLFEFLQVAILDLPRGHARVLLLRTLLLVQHIIVRCLKLFICLLIIPHLLSKLTIYINLSHSRS